MVLLLDAANTIIYKPRFYEEFLKVINFQTELNISAQEFEFKHKIISECFVFPDRTSKEFYNEFNSELLFSLGIIPTNELLESVFTSCSYLPWEKYEDTAYLESINCKKAILSNFHGGLQEIIDNHFPGQFSTLTISEIEKFRKPDIRFFESAIKQLNVDPSEIIYIGDSLKLDLEPALKVGMNAFLIDRNNYYPNCKRRISSFKEIQKLIS